MSASREQPPYFFFLNLFSVTGCLRLHQTTNWSLGLSRMSPMLPFFVTFPIPAQQNEIRALCGDTGTAMCLTLRREFRLRLGLFGGAMLNKAEEQKKKKKRSKKWSLGIRGGLLELEPI